MGINARLQELINLVEEIETKGAVWFVDGTNGDDDYSGTDWDHAKATIQAAVTAASAGDTIKIAPKLIVAGATDPTAYAETIIIPVAKANLRLVGIGDPAQGNLPEIKKGSGSTALITVRAPGCTIENLGINGASATGGGILLDDDSSTKTAFGTVIKNCHFKNCKGSSATDGRTGGAIMWSANGSAWQVTIKDNVFYKNVCDIVLLGTSISVPQNLIIENNIFSGPAASVDVNIYLAGGSGVNGVVIRNNDFPAMPAIGSGSVVRFADLTGCIGLLSGNRFGDTGTSTGYGAAKAKAKVPTTVLMASNYSEGGLITREA